MIPPVWLVLPIALALMAIYAVVILTVMKAQGRALPIPAWWRRVPSLRRRLAYGAILWHFVAASIMLWSIEPGNELPEAAGAARGLLSLAAWIVLGWVVVAAARSTEV